MLSATNQALIHIKDEVTLLNRVPCCCRCWWLSHGGWRLFAGTNKQKPLRPVAHADSNQDTLNLPELAGLITSAVRPGWHRNTHGTTLHSTQYSIGPAFAPWRETAIQRGYKSIIALPLISESQTFGAIGIYGELDAFDAREVEILRELANDLAFGITALRTRTKRDQAEEALKEQYSTLHSIIGSTNALIFSVDREYRYTSFNKGHAAVMKAIYGVEIEINHNLLDYMTLPKDREKARQNIDRALAGERHIESAVLRWGKLSRLYFEVSHNPICTEDGNVIGVAVFAQDITDRKQAEEALRESEERYDACSKVAEGILVADIATKKFMYANPAQCRIWDIQKNNWTNEHRRYSPSKGFRAGDGWIHGPGAWRKNSRGVGILDVHAKTALWFTLTFGYPDAQSNGKECNVGPFSDVTERKQTEEALPRAKNDIVSLLKIPRT